MDIRMLKKQTHTLQQTIRVLRFILSFFRALHNKHLGKLASLTIVVIILTYRKQLKKYAELLNNFGLKSSMLILNNHITQQQYEGLSVEAKQSLENYEVSRLLIKKIIPYELFKTLAAWQLSALQNEYINMLFYAEIITKNNFRDFSEDHLDILVAYKKLCQILNDKIITVKEFTDFPVFEDSEDLNKNILEPKQHLYALHKEGVQDLLLNKALSSNIYTKLSNAHLHLLEDNDTEPSIVSLIEQGIITDTKFLGFTPSHLEALADQELRQLFFDKKINCDQFVNFDTERLGVLIEPAVCTIIAKDIITTEQFCNLPDTHLNALAYPNVRNELLNKTMSYEKFVATTAPQALGRKNAAATMLTQYISSASRSGSSKDDDYDYKETYPKEKIPSPKI